MRIVVLNSAIGSRARPRYTLVMNHVARWVWCLALFGLVSLRVAAQQVVVSGDLKQWHKVTLTLDGPPASETDTQPNPFTDYSFEVTFTHASGNPKYLVPGYFAADGNAANTSATSGNKWRAHFSPDKPGQWNYLIHFSHGPLTAVGQGGRPLPPYDGLRGSLSISPTDKHGPDFRAHGRLEYVGKHHLRFAGSGLYFLKVGADSPEALLAYADFDGTEPGRARAARQGEANPTQQLHSYATHLHDWKHGDPTWKGGLGKGLIGALNYLASQGANAISFLTYNAGGDGDNVWPFVGRAERMHYDVSKLDQWQIVFDHAQALGLFLHFKTQETENDDLNGPGRDYALDRGELGPERKLYYRELIARFGYLLALNWNLGEENTQTADQQRAMAKFFHDHDPWQHPVVIHTYPDWQDRVYSQLLGNKSFLAGASLQNPWNAVHQRTLHWVRASAASDRPWVVANDEQNPPEFGVPPDPGYDGQSGLAKTRGNGYSLHDIRKLTLWGNLMAGGAGVEYYFGYQFPQNDLTCEDWRSRERSWRYGHVALEFFQRNQIPFWEMSNANSLVGNPQNENRAWCLAKPGQLYMVYLPSGGTTELDLTEVHGRFDVQWFNPRSGGPLERGDVRRVNAGSKVSLGQPPSDPKEDWLAVVKRATS